jgi:glycosyltransferase involved in cell wall biosynthesis
MSFSLVVPARDEAAVIGDTLRRLLKQTHTVFQIVVSLCEDDTPTIAAVQAVIDAQPAASRITLVTGRYAKPSKAQQLNRALGAIWRNNQTGAPVTRSLIAYDH